MPRNDIKSLPPKARAAAMHKPYRSGRLTQVIAIAVVALFLAGFAIKVRMGQPAPPKPPAPVAKTPAVLYLNLPPPAAAPGEQPAAPAPALPP
ncbi:MAG: hypothetical protein ACT4PZ_12425 [Panacagrimonas sp.]